MPLLSAFYRWRSWDTERPGDLPKVPQLGSGTKSWSVSASKGPDFVIISSFQQATQNSTCGYSVFINLTSDIIKYPMHIPTQIGTFLLLGQKTTGATTVAKAEAFPFSQFLLCSPPSPSCLQSKQFCTPSATPALRPAWVLRLGGSGFPGPLLDPRISIFKKPSNLAPSFVELVWIPGFKFPLHPYS